MHLASMQSWGSGPSIALPPQAAPRPASHSLLHRTVGATKEATPWGARAGTWLEVPSYKAAPPRPPGHMSPLPPCRYEVKTDYLTALTYASILSPSPCCTKNHLSVEQVGGGWKGESHNDEGNIFSTSLPSFQRPSAVRSQFSSQQPRTGLHWTYSENPEKPGCLFQRKLGGEAVSRTPQVGSGPTSRNHLG